MLWRCARVELKHSTVVVVRIVHRSHLKPVQALHLFKGLDLLPRLCLRQVVTCETSFQELTMITWSPHSPSPRQSPSRHCFWNTATAVFIIETPMRDFSIVHFQSYILRPSSFQNVTSLVNSKFNKSTDEPSSASIRVSSMSWWILSIHSPAPDI